MRIDPIWVNGARAAATTATTIAPTVTMTNRRGRPGRGVDSTAANSAPSSILFCCFAAGISANAATTLATNTAANGIADIVEPCDSISPTMKITMAGTRLAAGTNVVTSRQATSVP